MKLSDMSPELQAGRRVFIDSLSAAGWDVESWDAVLDAGQDVEPEAEASYSGAVFDLSLSYNAGGTYLGFELDERGGELFLSFRLHPATDLTELLARITAAQDALNTENMAEIVKTLIPLCNPLLIDTDEGLQKLSV